MGKIPFLLGRRVSCKNGAKCGIHRWNELYQRLTPNSTAMDPPVRSVKWRSASSKKVVCVLFFEGEASMVWGLVRVSIFTTAFLIGMVLVGSGGPFSSVASSQTPAIPQLD